MKSITARATSLIFSLYLLVGFVAAQAYAGEYYIYRDSTGLLVISNQKPPPESKIIKQHNFPDFADGDAPPLKDDKRSNDDTSSSKTPRNNK